MNYEDVAVPAVAVKGKKQRWNAKAPCACESKVKHLVKLHSFHMLHNTGHDCWILAS